MWTQPQNITFVQQSAGAETLSIKDVSQCNAVSLKTRSSIFTNCNARLNTESSLKFRFICNSLTNLKLSFLTRCCKEKQIFPLQLKSQTKPAESEVNLWSNRVPCYLTCDGLTFILTFYVSQSKQVKEMADVSYITPWHLSAFCSLCAFLLHTFSSFPPLALSLAAFRLFFSSSSAKHALWLWALASLASVCSSRSDCWSLFMRTWVSMLLSPTFTCKYACIQYLHSSFRGPWEAFKGEVNKRV